MNYNSILYIFILLISVWSNFATGAPQKSGQISVINITAESNLSGNEGTGEKDKVLKKRQVFVPFGAQNTGIQNVFGSMCGILISCTNSFGGVMTYDYYDYGFGVFGAFGGSAGFGAFGGFGGTSVAWPFSFMGGGFFG